MTEYDKFAKGGLAPEEAVGGDNKKFTRGMAEAADKISSYGRIILESEEVGERSLQKSLKDIDSTLEKQRILKNIESIKSGELRAERRGNHGVWSKATILRCLDLCRNNSNSKAVDFIESRIPDKLYTGIVTQGGEGWFAWAPSVIEYVRFDGEDSPGIKDAQVKEILGELKKYLEAVPGEIK